MHCLQCKLIQRSQNKRLYLAKTSKNMYFNMQKFKEFDKNFQNGTLLQIIVKELEILEYLMMRKLCFKVGGR